MPALTPQLALEYLAQLSTDIRAAVVLDDERRLLAGDPGLAPAAADLLEASDAPALEVRTERGLVFAARSATHSLVVATGRLALPALVLYDLRLVLGDLAGEEGAAA